MTTEYWYTKICHIGGSASVAKKFQSKKFTLKTNSFGHINNKHIMFANTVLESTIIHSKLIGQPSTLQNLLFSSILMTYTKYCKFLVMYTT